jgi:hypothetical protein
MITNDNLDKASASQIGTASNHKSGRVPGWRWILLWTALTTMVFPATFLLSAPFSALLMVIFDVGVDTGIIFSYDLNLLKSIGSLIGFSLTMATFQWLLLHNYLLNGRTWFLATGMGLLVGGLLAMASTSALSNIVVEQSLIIAAYLLLIGGVVGIAQWLILRRILPNAFWVVIIDIAAASSLLLIPRPITNTPEILRSLIVLMLPGGIAGLGIWLLMRNSQPNEGISDVPSPTAKQKRFKPVLWIGSGLAALIPTFFLCSWIYAASQLALAKNRGIYSTVEEAVILKNSQGWGGAEVIKVEDVRASVNQHDGSQPHVWFGGARVYLDRVPQGWDRTSYSSGSYYLHVKEGWVLVPEGAFPEFIGWVMELYNMEGVDEWIAENK